VSKLYNENESFDGILKEIETKKFPFVNKNCSIFHFLLISIRNELNRRLNKEIRLKLDFIVLEKFILKRKKSKKLK